MVVIGGTGMRREANGRQQDSKSQETTPHAENRGQARTRRYSGTYFVRIL